MPLAGLAVFSTETLAPSVFTGCSISSVLPSGSPSPGFQSIWYLAQFFTTPAVLAASVTFALKLKVVDLPGSSEMPVHSKRLAPVLLLKVPAPLALPSTYSSPSWIVSVTQALFVAVPPLLVTVRV